MGKLLGLVLMLIGLYMGMEVYTKGAEHALGGAFASFDEGASDDAPRATTPQRAGQAVQRAHAVADERRSRLLQD